MFNFLNLKKAAAGAAAILTAAGLMSCSSLVSPVTKKVDVTVSCKGRNTTIASARLVKDEALKNAIKNYTDDTLTAFLTNFAESYITLKVTGSSVKEQSQTVDLYDNALDNLVDLVIAQGGNARDYTNQLGTILSSLTGGSVYSFPVSFSFSELPVGTRLTFTATLGYMSDRTLFTVSNTKTTVLNEGSNSLSISVDKNTATQAYDWDLLASYSLAVVNKTDFTTTIYVSTENELSNALNTNYSSSPSKETVNIILNNDISLSSSSSFSFKDNNCDTYINLNNKTLTVTQAPSNEINFNNYAEETLCIYNGTVKSSLSATPTGTAIFAQNSQKGNLIIDNVTFSSFNMRILTQYAEGEITTNYCKFENCKTNQNTNGLISMFPDSDYNSGTINLTGCRFTNCNNYDYSLLNVKGTMNLQDCIIKIKDFVYNSSELYSTVLRIDTASNVYITGCKFIDDSAENPLIGFKKMTSEGENCNIYFCDADAGTAENLNNILQSTYSSKLFNYPDGSLEADISGPYTWNGKAYNE